jgi:hypothetical protein
MMDFTLDPMASGVPGVCNPPVQKVLESEFEDLSGRGTVAATRRRLCFKVNLKYSVNT